MDVDDEGPRVARGEGTAARGVVRAERLDEAARPLGPGGEEPLVAGVVGAAARDPDVGVGEEELADAGVEREALDARLRAGGVDEHRGGAVDEVARDDLLLRDAREELGLGVDGARAADPPHGEDRPDGAVDVEVGGAVERVDEDDVLPRRGGDGLVLGEAGREVHLLGDDGRDELPVGEGLEEDVVGEGVELLLLLALDVRLPRRAEDLGEAGAGEDAGDPLARERELGEEGRELAGRLRVAPLGLEEVAVEAGPDRSVCPSRRHLLVRTRAARGGPRGGPRGAENRTGVVEDDPDRDAREQRPEPPLGREGGEEAVAKEREDLRRDAAADVDAAGGEGLQREVPRLAAVERDEAVHRPLADGVGLVERGAADDGGGVAGGGDALA